MFYNNDSTFCVFYTFYLYRSRNKIKNGAENMIQKADLISVTFNFFFPEYNTGIYEKSIISVFPLQIDIENSITYFHKLQPETK